MSQVYKITENEINQTILHSPYSLADSPAKAGLKAMQIKKYFYNFIRFFAEKINIHLGDIGSSLENVDELFEAVYKKLEELEGTDISLGNSIKASLDYHNKSADTHNDIRRAIGINVSTHNGSSTSHQDIRTYLKELKDKLNATYALASGKQRVHLCETVLDALGQSAIGDVNVGDLLLVADDNEVDFTVFEKGLSQGYENDIAVDYTGVANGEFTFEAGKIYFFKGKRLLASKGTLETGLLAKQDDLEELEDSFFARAELVNNKLAEIENVLLTKQEKLNTVEHTAQTVDLETGCEYNLGLRTSVIIELEANDIEAIINFRSGITPTTFDAPSEILFQGDDTLDGRLYPVSNRLYEINIKNVMGVLVARVGATDFEVIE